METALAIRKMLATVAVAGPELLEAGGSRK